MRRTGYSRREFVTLATALAAVASVSDAAQTSRQRPNILWLVSEDNNPFIGAYGDRLAHTPAIDSLAAGGVLYQNVFSNAPVCAPSRFAIITGMYPESCGPAHHMRAQGKLPAFLQGFPKYLREAGYYCTNNVKTDYNADLDMQAMWNESSERAHWRNRPDGAPFFAVFNFMTTHESRMFKVTAGRVKPEDVRVPAYLPDLPEVRRDLASYYNLMETMDGEVGAHLAALESAGLAEDTIVFYYSDNGGVQPRSKRYCYDEGLRTALVMRVPKKWAHLAPAPAGSRINAPVSFIDLAPTVLTLAGMDPPAYMQGRSLVTKRQEPRQYVFGMRNRMDERYDMVRTVRDDRYRYIRNYSPHRPYGQHQAFEWQMDSYRALERAYRAGTLNTVQARFFGEKAAEEFYDLKADPDEINNLIGAKEHRERIEAMRVTLDAHMLRVNDNGFIPESSPVEGYDASRAAGAYPLQRVMQIAAKAIVRDARNVSEFASLLSDANEVVRYWAAQGLLMLGAKAAGAKGALETCLSKDASHSVRIAAAEALAFLGGFDRAVQYLGSVIDSPADEHDARTVANAEANAYVPGSMNDSRPDVRVQLQALNALTFIGEPAKPLLAMLERVLEATQDEYIRNASRYLIFVLRGTYTPESPVYQGRAARVT